MRLMLWRFRITIVCCGLSGVLAAGAMIRFIPHLGLFASEIDLLLREIEHEPPLENIDELLEKTIARAKLTRSWEPDPQALAETQLSRIDVAHVARHLREQYPFASLRNRLAYEKKAHRRMSTLSSESEDRLSLEEDPSLDMRVKAADFDPRMESLQMLHSNEVIRFITQEGFGFSRYTPPSITFLELEDVCPLPTDPKPKSIDAGNPVSLPNDEPTYYELAHGLRGQDREQHIQQRYEQWVEKDNPFRLPTRTRLMAIHKQSKTEFAGWTRNGYARNIDQVAGFASHAVTSKPEIRIAEPHQKPVEWIYESQVVNGKPRRMPIGLKPRTENRLWRLTKMHLVSLLKHNTPRAYVSDNVPNMEALLEAPTRPLEKSEAALLEQLHEGKDIATDAHANRIRMLGSLRAQKHCTTCHDAHRGELLGAFSYELLRVTAN